MTATVTPAMRKKAEQLAEGAHLWHRGRSKRNGQAFYLVPGSKPGVVYYSNHLGCTCPGFRNRGVCALQQAALIVLQRAEDAIRAETQPAPAKSAQQLHEERQQRRGYAALMGDDDDKPFCTPCNRHHDADRHYGQVAA